MSIIVSRNREPRVLLGFQGTLGYVFLYLHISMCIYVYTYLPMSILVSMLLFKGQVTDANPTQMKVRAQVA